MSRKNVQDRPVRKLTTDCRMMIKHMLEPLYAGPSSALYWPGLSDEDVKGIYGLVDEMRGVIFELKGIQSFSDKRLTVIREVMKQNLAQFKKIQLKEKYDPKIWE